LILDSLIEYPENPPERKFLLNVTTLVSSVLIVEQFNSSKSINELIKELMNALFLLQVLFLSMGLLIGVVAGSTKRTTITQ
jgi:beta-exotoxin I transport system permease protein